MPGGRVWRLSGISLLVGQEPLVSKGERDQNTLVAKITCYSKITFSRRAIRLSLDQAESSIHTKAQNRPHHF